MVMARFFVMLIATVTIAAPAFARQNKPAGTGAPAAPGLTEHMGMHIMTVAAEMKWVDGPPSLPKGAKVAVLEGDPSKPGPFTMRARVPARYKIAPHWHPAIEHVTVISGECYMASGETYDESVGKKLTAGSFAVMPIKHPHFFFTKKKAEIQLHGIGPWGITYINPADDPRNAVAPAPTPSSATK